MDDKPDPEREGNMPAATQSLDPSVPESIKPTEAMTGDSATANLGPTISDQEHGEATKEGTVASSSESVAKSRRIKHARVHFVDPVTLAKPELKKSDTASQTEHNVEDPLVGSDQESDKQVLADDDLEGALPKVIDFAAVAKESESPAGTSHAKGGAVAENEPKVGFKHDPGEEKFLANVELDVGTKKKKKNKRRPKSQRGENAPSGFEPFYADAPMTPQEFEENKTIYDPALPILDRIDEGIKRFLYKRRLEPYRRKVFLKYLQYGGVSVGPNHSQGVTPSELKEMTKEEAMQARCTTAIFPKKGKPYPISFNDVATGYLTGFYMGYYNPDTEEEIKVCTDTMKNFFTYLLYHDVCPEQKEDLEEARRTCDRSAKELWMNQQLVHHQGPGDFNRGCSVLFGGYYFEDVDDPDAWTNVRYADQVVFTTDMARKVVKYAIAIAGNERTAHKFKILVDMEMTEAKKVPDIDGFEIISVEEPTEETIAYYNELCPDLNPVGKIRAKEFRDPARGPFDLAPWEKVDWDAGFAPTYDFEFLVEADLFAHILPGMKIITDVFETNFGQYYFDEILSVLPSFYKFMYNDWMMDYVEPVPLDFIPDEEEVARRRAKESIMSPPEPTPAEWAMHMLTHELTFNLRPGDDAMVAVWQMIHTLEAFGWDLEEVKDLMGLVDPNPRKGKEKSTEGEQPRTRLSNEPRNISPFETPKQKLDRTINHFQNPEKIKPVIAPEVIAKFLKEKKEKIEREQLEKEKLEKEIIAKFLEKKEQLEKEFEKQKAQQGARTSKKKVAKGSLEGQPGKRSTSRGTQTTSKEQVIAETQEPKGHPSRGPTKTSKEQAVEKKEEIKVALEGDN